MNPHLSRATWLRLALTAVILGYLLARVDLRAVGAALVQVRLTYLAFVLVLVACDRILMVLRWYLLLRASETAVSLKSATWIYLVSSFVGSFLPAGVGADAARAVTLGRRTAQNSEAIASVAVDRMAGLLSIVLLGVIGGLLWTGRIDAGVRQASVLIGLIVVVGVMVVGWGDRALRTVVPARWLASPLGASVARLADAMARYRRRPAVLLSVMLLSVMVQILRVLQAYLLGRGLDIAVEFLYYLVFMPIGLLMLLLPVSISGFGLPQGVIVWLLRPVGVPDAQSFVLSTLIVLTGVAGNLPGAWLYVRRRKT